MQNVGSAAHFNQNVKIKIFFPVKISPSRVPFADFFPKFFLWRVK